MKNIITMGSFYAGDSRIVSCALDGGLKKVILRLIVKFSAFYPAPVWAATHYLSSSLRGVGIIANKVSPVTDPICDFRNVTNLVKYQFVCQNVRSYGQAVMRSYFLLHKVMI